MATANPYLSGLATGGAKVNTMTGVAPLAQPKKVPVAQNLGLGSQISTPAGGAATMQTMVPQQSLSGTMPATQSMPTAPQMASNPYPMTSNLGMGGPMRPNAQPQVQALVQPAVPQTSGNLAQYYKDRLAYQQKTGFTNPAPEDVPMTGGGNWSWQLAADAKTGSTPQEINAEKEALMDLQLGKKSMTASQHGLSFSGQSEKDLYERNVARGWDISNWTSKISPDPKQSVENLGLSGPSSSAVSAYTPSPYLQSQLQNLQGDYNKNLDNTLHGQNQAAVSTGNLGSSRSGLMAGQAIGDSQSGFAKAATDMLGADYTNAMNRNLQNKSLDQSLYLGNQANDTQRFGITTGANTAKYSTDANTSLGYAGLANQANIAQGQLGLGYTQAGNALTLGQGQLALGNRTADQNYSLGQGQLGVSQQNANTTRDLGFGQLGNAQQQTANQLALGNAQNQNQATANANSFSLGNAANTNQANQIGNNLALGQGQLALGNTQAQNSYNLGLGQNSNQATANANNLTLGQGQLANASQGQALNFYSDQRNQDRQDLGLGASLYGSGIQGPWNPIQNYNGLMSPYTGQGTSSSTTGGQSGGWQGLIGGGIQGYALAKQMGLLG